MSDRGRRATTVLGFALLTASGAWYCDSRPPPPPLEDQELPGQPLLEVVRRLRHEIRELRLEALELHHTLDHLQAEQWRWADEAPSRLRFDHLVCGEAASPPPANEANGWVQLASRTAKP